MYDAIERCVAVLAANFATDLAALAAAKSVTLFSTTATLYPRLGARGFETQTLPGIGVHARSLTTTLPRNQALRDSNTTVIVEYLARTPTGATVADAATLGKQGELAAQAILRAADRMAGAGDVLDVQSIEVATEGAQKREGQTQWEVLMEIRFTVITREQGLT